jgi:hypothetical protein
VLGAALTGRAETRHPLPQAGRGEHGRGSASGNELLSTQHSAPSRQQARGSFRFRSVTSPGAGTLGLVLRSAEP